MGATMLDASRCEGMSNTATILLAGVRTFAAALTIAALSASLAFGQAVTSTLTGTVTDTSGAAIPNAAITLTNELSGDVRKSVTNTAGYYSLSAVPAGTYTLAVETKGFAREERKGVALTSADTRNLDFAMKVGSVNETVEVTTALDQLATVDSGEKSANLDTATLENIAIVGQSAGEYLKILPGMNAINGTTNKPGFTGEFIGINGSGGASALGQYVANGTPTSSMEITSDGAHVSDPGCNCGTPVNPNPSMVQEVHVLQAAFSAENAYGPVVINTTTKAGGSSFHGHAFFSTRNYVLNANDSASNAKGSFAGGGLVAPRPPNVFYFPGGNIGGPVIIPHTGFNRNRDKLFFFSGFEIFLQKENTSLAENIVPDAAMRGGNFSPAEIATLNPASGVGGGLKTLNSSFPGGIIPASRINPSGLAMMNLLPLPNADPFQTGGYNFVKFFSFNQNGYQMVHRVDYSISDNTKLFIRWYHQHEIQNWPVSMWGGSNAGLLGGLPNPSPDQGNNHSESLALNLTHVFSPTVTNEFVITYSYVGFANTETNPTAELKSTVGYTYHGAFDNGDPFIPDLSLGGVAALGQQGGFDAARKYYNNVYPANKPLSGVGDNLTKIWRTHSLRVGFHGEYYGNFQPQQGKAQGVITTAANDPTGSGNALADLLLGNVNSFSQQNFNPPAYIASVIAEFYVQDSWKATRRLTLDYGMRFQHDPFGKDLYHLGHAVWVPSEWSNNPSVYLPGFDWFGKNPKIPNEGYPTRPMFYAPRFGEAWDVFGTGKTVIRSGIGLYRYRGPSGGGGSGVGQLQPTGSAAYSPVTSSGTTLAAIDASGTSTNANGFFNGFFNGQGLAETGLPDPNSSQLSMTWTDDFTVAQQLPYKTLMEVSFVNTMGRHVAESTNHNVNAVPFGAMLATPTASNLLFRPYSNYQDITISAYDAYSDYNSLQATVKHQGGKLMISGNYTFSKATGSTASSGDQFNVRNDHGPLAFDHRQVANFTYSYQMGSLIHSSRLLEGAVNGWTVSGFIQLSSGSFLQAGGQLGLGTLPSGSTVTGITGTPDMLVYPVLTCDPRKNLGPNQYLNPSCYALPTKGTNGSFVEPEAFGPGFFNTDMSLFKTFKFNEKKSLQFRAEGFNFLNHSNPTFGLDNNLNLAFNAAGQQTNALFGTAVLKTGHRIMQFAVKFYF
jgi:hypothetical protein